MIIWAPALGHLAWGGVVGKPMIIWAPALGHLVLGVVGEPMCCSRCPCRGCSRGADRLLCPTKPGAGDVGLWNGRSPVLGSPGCLERSGLLSDITGGYCTERAGLNKAITDHPSRCERLLQAAGCFLVLRFPVGLMKMSASTASW